MCWCQAGTKASSPGWCRITVERRAVCLKSISEWWAQPGPNKRGSVLISTSSAFWLAASAAPHFPTQRRLSSVESDSPSFLILRHDQSSVRRVMDVHWVLSLLLPGPRSVQSFVIHLSPYKSMCAEPCSLFSWNYLRKYHSTYIYLNSYFKNKHVAKLRSRDSENFCTRYNSSFWVQCKKV